MSDRVGNTLLLRSALSVHIVLQHKTSDLDMEYSHIHTEDCVLSSLLVPMHNHLQLQLQGTSTGSRSKAVKCIKAKHLYTQTTERKHTPYH